MPCQKPQTPTAEEARAAQFAEGFELLDADPAARRQLSKTFPPFFDAYYCGMRQADFREAWLTLAISRYVEAQVALREGKPRKAKLLLLGPRKHGKTELVITLVTLLILLNRNIRVLFIGESDAMAIKRLSRVKALLRSERVTVDWCSDPAAGYGPILPAKRKPEDDVKWDQTAIRVLRDANHVNHTVETCGLGSAITGGHYDIIIADDPESTKSVLSAVKRANNKEWFGGTVQPMLNPGGLFLCIGTRKHHDDLYAFIEGDATWEVVEDPAILPDDDGKIRIPDFELIHRLDDRGRQVIEDVRVKSPCRVLWPEERPIEWLIMERESSALGYTGFAREFLHVVQDEGAALFKRDLLDTAIMRGGNLVLPSAARPRGGPWPERMLIVQAWDPAFVVDKQKAERGDRDYAVGVTWGIDLANRDRYLLDVHRERGDSKTEKKHNVIRMWKRWAPPAEATELQITDYVDGRWVYAVAMEKNSAGEFLGIDVGEAADVPLVLHHTGRQKADALDGVPRLANLLERGKIVLPYGDLRTQAIVDTVVEESHGMPHNAHDDCVLAIWIAECLAVRALHQYDEWLDMEAA